MISESFSIQENGDNERSTPPRRRMNVLDEKALREDDTKLIREQRIDEISRSYQLILESVGEDPSRQSKFTSNLFFNFVFRIGRLKTPKCAAEVSKELFLDIKRHFTLGEFDECSLVRH